MKVCLVGLGIIGYAWAPHYRKAGYELSTWNRTPKDVDGFVKDLAQAAEGADVIHIVVADPPAVESVLDQLKVAIAPGTLVIQSSTISGEWARKFSDAVTKLGADYVEAPFTGSKIAAEEGANVFFVGGEDAGKAKAREVLAPVAKTFFDMGAVEQACGIKLAMNLQIALVSQALNEGLSLARSNGIGDDQFFEVLSENVSMSGVAALKKPKLMAKDYSPQFSVKHMHKDLRLALSSASEQLLPLTSQNAKIYAKGEAGGMEDDDFCALIQLLES